MMQNQIFVVILEGHSPRKPNELLPFLIRL